MLAKDKYRFHRAVDKWLGSLLLFLLGLCRRKRPAPSEVRRIVLIKADGLGDLLLVTGLTRDIRATWPDAEITLLCGPFNHALAALLEDWDRIVLLRLSNPLPAIRALRAWRPDVCVDLGEWSRLEALIAFASGARWTVGFNTPAQHRHYAHDTWLPHRRDQHELDNFRSLLEPLGVKTGHRPAVALRERPEKDAARALPALTSPYAILHLWSGSARYAWLKEWPLDRWRALARWLNERGYAAYLTGGLDDVVRTDAFIESCGWPEAAVHSLAGTAFDVLIRILRAAALVVSIDTSISHLAGVLDVPVLTLHGPTSSKRWGPLGDWVEVIDTPVAGCGYMNWGADSTPEQSALKCMDGIPLEAVVAKVRTMLRDAASESST